MNRREFVTSATCVASSALFVKAASAEPVATIVLEKGGWRAAFSASGALQSFRDAKTELVNQRMTNFSPHILYPGLALNVCDRPARTTRTTEAASFFYEFSDPRPIKVELHMELVALKNGSIGLRQKFVIDSEKTIASKVIVQLPIPLQLPATERSVFLPMKNGVGRKKQILGLDNEDNYVYELAGPTAMGRNELLALPMVHEYQAGDNLRLTHVTDPMFTSLLRLPYGSQVGQWQWVYPEHPGLPAGRHEREYVSVAHGGGPGDAMNVFYEAILPDVAQGPDWLHDIALVNFDYLSKNGQGWFHDIEKLSAMISREDRGKVALVLHAWYDTVGQYAYDPRSKTLMEKWTAFPSARAAETQMLGLDPDEGGMPSMALTPGYKWQRASVLALEPVPFTVQEVHRRIRFAKDRGFRVFLYFADGLNACDDSPFFRPDQVLSWGGWQGPDTSGRVYRRNPLHPEVRAFYTGYMAALLREYSTVVDGFVWDETFGIRGDALGTPDFPGYASPAMMSLLKEVAQLVSRHPGLAFMASDNLGYENGLQGAPYCLMAHGTYQDSHCRPEAWPYALFPNFRNIVWSCNWAPVTNLAFMEFGVHAFNAPVSIGNGAFGDDIGISDMTTAQARHIIDMFQDRKRRRMQLEYIEENERSGRYEGRTFGNRYNIL